MLAYAYRITVGMCAWGTGYRLWKSVLISFFV